MKWAKQILLLFANYNNMSRSIVEDIIIVWVAFLLTKMAVYAISRNNCPLWKVFVVYCRNTR